VARWEHPKPEALNTASSLSRSCRKPESKNPERDTRNPEPETSKRETRNSKLSSFEIRVPIFESVPVSDSKEFRFPISGFRIRRKNSGFRVQNSETRRQVGERGAVGAPDPKP
jgi:hypothetical protein